MSENPFRDQPFMQTRCPNVFFLLQTNPVTNPFDKAALSEERTLNSSIHGAPLVRPFWQENWLDVKHKYTILRKCMKKIFLTMSRGPYIGMT
ncbi:hypothetical protein PWF83_21875 (plasmid) [Pantoea dispersa]|uniref:hypothetical protein n=1 Tax=Pantoea TaxID=53335 RepID=UPI0011B0597B|nr:MULTISPECIES: hypothetical protein [Pantoea]NIG33728.1 hypothetical protein [Pantoea sp. Ap-959]WEA07943.1 hypothetical protein PWF83_21875 [Pantoea dispersa]